MVVDTSCPDQESGPHFSSKIPSVTDLDLYIKETKPQYPVSVLFPEFFQTKAEEFTQTFPGRVLYAVKCNPDQRLIRALIEGGIDSFDCASISEIRHIRALKPEATIYFMHPIKSREAIREAYFTHGVRAFVLDTLDELEKILKETKEARDLKLFVRMAVPKQKVLTDFSSKFGAPPVLAAEILKKARDKTQYLGVSFHVGTQCMQAEAYGDAVHVVASTVQSAGISIEALDIGGGFPATLDPGQPPPPFSAYVQCVTKALEASGLSNIDLLCEPGRGLVAGGGALVVRVEGRKGDLLFLNDGTYGGIFEGSGSIGIAYPVRMICCGNKKISNVQTPFRFAGPTCDSIDMMNGPFFLPENITEGDYIVLDQLGAYGEISRTPFNGFDQVIGIEVVSDAAADRNFVRKGRSS